MLTIYGIKNCDIMQKAFKWLASNGIEYKFHDFRVAGLDRTTIEQWLKNLPLEKVVNLRSTTYRELPADERSALADPIKAVDIIIKNNSIVKRPLWDTGNGKYFVGFNDEVVQKVSKEV